MLVVYRAGSGSSLNWTQLFLRAQGKGFLFGNGSSRLSEVVPYKGALVDIRLRRRMLVLGQGW